MNSENTSIKTSGKIFSTWKPYLVAAVFVVSIACLLGYSREKGPATTTAAQMTFATPAEAGQALQAAAKSDDEKALTSILGPKSGPILSSGDPAEDKAALQYFVSKYDQMNRWVAMTDGGQVLNIGADNYPFPIPLAQDAAARWYFNTPAGEDEILARRIGRNELLAMDACSAIANAEELYFASASRYTPKIISTSGTQDGLYWEAPAPSPLGKLNDFAPDAISSAGSTGSLTLDGYSFRVLTAQGNEADGGERSYLANQQLTKGFAVIAAPVKYRDSGIMTFIMGGDGVVYQRDLGPNTVDVAASITTYNPTEEWIPVE
jgi:Protein of unknown function (DUF2950)